MKGARAHRDPLVTRPQILRHAFKSREYLVQSRRFARRRAAARIISSRGQAARNAEEVALVRPIACDYSRRGDPL